MILTLFIVGFGVGLVIGFFAGYEIAVCRAAVQWFNERAENERRRRRNVDRVHALFNRAVDDDARQKINEYQSFDEVVKKL